MKRRKSKFVYMLRPKYDEYEFIVFDNPAADYSIQYSFNGESIDSWTNIDIVIESKKGLKKGDFPDFATHIPVFSKNAISSMEEILSSYGQILPLNCSQGDYFAYNVTTVIDGLNEEKSEIIRIPTGKIMTITKFIINRDKLAGQYIFKLKRAELMDVFVTEDFVELVKKNKLSGFDFHEIELV